MNKYQIQIDHQTENKWDWICVFADSDEEAIQNAKIKLSDYQNPVYLQNDDYGTKYWKDYYKEYYKGYKISDYLPIFSIERNCNPPKDYDIINSSNAKEIQDMPYFQVNWNQYTDTLAKLAKEEKWSNETYPDNKILTNYLVHTYEKLTSEHNIIANKDFGLFNTGLFTEYYQSIYAYHDNNGLQFLTDYELGNMNISERPQRANYFDNPSLLLFDWHYEININYKHILSDIDNLKRIPDSMKENILNNLNGSIDTMKKRVSANYKLAIPQYYEKKIQLLLPLCLGNDDTPNLALTVTKIGNYYQGHTCLTLDMAYNNARLIAKPESNWLNP